MKYSAQIAVPKTRCSPLPNSILQRACACGQHTGAGGECAECRKQREGTLQRSAISSEPAGAALLSPGQPRFGHDFSGMRVGNQIPTPSYRGLRVNTPGDSYEIEAERMAQQILTMPDIAIQRAPSDQASGAGSNAPMETSGTGDQFLPSSGAALDHTTRTFFETHFERDFSAVRVHTGAEAARANRDLQARAFTVGSNIYFASGQYDPASAAGRQLLAHELTHVAQQRQAIQPRIQRAMDSCADLIANASPVSLISGRAVHALIAEHFNSTVGGATSAMIPGASAGPLRSQAICGGDSKIIDPQIIGGNAGAGFPDLARLTPGGILQVAEIKPAATPCLIDGEEQVMRYIDQGNARDAAQTAWRGGQGIKVVSPMPESAYSPPNLETPNVEIRTAWCSPGLLAYSVRARGTRVPVPVPKPSTQDADEKKKKETPQQQPVPLGAPAPALSRAQAIRLIVQFVEMIVATEISQIDQAATRFLHENPALSAFIITAGVAVIITLVADDLTLVGIADDLAIPPIILALWRAAAAL